MQLFVTPGLGKEIFTSAPGDILDQMNGNVLTILPVIEPAVSPVASSSRHHHRCEPTAKRAGQTAKHSGPTTKRPTIAERATFTLWCVCGRRFRRRQDLAGHSSSCKSSSSAAP